MFEILKPFLQILLKRNIPLSKWSILKTLIVLAVLKRTKPGKPNPVKLGRYNIYTPDYEVLSLLIKEKFINEEYKFSAGNSSPIIIDCGTSIGVSMLYFKCLYPESTIYCFEPNTEAFKYLTMNVTVNGLENIHLYNQALSDQDGHVNLYIPDKRAMINSSLRDTSALPYETVPSSRLSQYLLNFKTIDLIKLDVEGAEWEIVQDLDESFILAKGMVKQFIIEYHTRIRPDKHLNTFIGLFESRKYVPRVKVLFGNNPESDMLIYAKRLDPDCTGI